MTEAALRIGREIGYTSAGTVEFLVTPSGEFYFLEVNTRIQVEHPVTELITGLDLVRMQIETAEGQPVGHWNVSTQGHAIEARLYAEDPANGFLPSTGRILAWRTAGGVQVESGIEVGTEVGIHYDPLLAKFIAHAETRDGAIRKLRHSLESTVVHGVTTNREFLGRILEHSDFQAGRVHTGFQIPYEPDRTGEADAAAALKAYLAARRQAERRILPGVPPDYRNNPFRGSSEGPAVKVISCEPGRLRAEIDGVQRAFDISEDATQYWVGANTFPRVSRYPFPESATSGEAASSPMPGQVLRILVEVGARVRSGDALVVLEAMKMEQTVVAHSEGLVEAVLVTPGQVVAPGQTLVRVRSKENPE
jgi:propionyl-CoA carboxylase alpha chain